MPVDSEFERLLEAFRGAALRYVDEQAGPVIEQKRREAQRAQNELELAKKASDAQQAIANQARDFILTGDEEKAMRLMELQAGSGFDFARVALGLRETIPGVTDHAIHETLAAEAEAKPDNARLQGMLEVSSLVTIQPVAEGQEPHYPF